MAGLFPSTSATSSKAAPAPRNPSRGYAGSVSVFYARKLEHGTEHAVCMRLVRLGRANRGVRVISARMVALWWRYFLKRSAKLLRHWQKDGLTTFLVRSHSRQHSLCFEIRLLKARLKQLMRFAYKKTAKFRRSSQQSGRPRSLGTYGLRP